MAQYGSSKEGRAGGLPWRQETHQAFYAKLQLQGLFYRLMAIALVQKIKVRLMLGLDDYHGRTAMLLDIHYVEVLEAGGGFVIFLTHATPNGFPGLLHLLQRQRSTAGRGGG